MAQHNVLLLIDRNDGSLIILERFRDKILSVITIMRVYHTWSVL